jgi:multicomponent Na+:H+ antiporter subunit D
VSSLPALAVAVPIGAALVILGIAGLEWRRTADAVAIAASAATAALCGVLVHRSAEGAVLHWFGGWTPRHGFPVGVSFTVDPVGAGVATLAAALVLVSLVAATRYFDHVSPLVHALVLLFLTGMVGFALTGDLFNLFVFFELMSVAAYGLTAYKSEEEGALQGTLNFAVANSIGAFCVLLGIALLYARTGTLSLAGMGDVLARHPADGLVVVSAALVLGGFLVKGAMVPFHFWLVDAHTSAPTPICVVFSGVMVELGLYGAGRVFWTVFADALDLHGMRGVLVTLGVLTSVVGAVLCVMQHHLKRMLAFSTVSHAGTMLAGIGLLDPGPLGGVAVYVLAHGMVKGSLFLCCAVLVHRLGAFDEARLHGRGRDLRVTAAVWTVGALALAGLPPFGTYLGKGLLDEGLAHHGLWVVAVVLAACSAATGAAVLHAGAHVFLGWGVVTEDDSSRNEGEEDEEDTQEEPKTPLVMIGPALLLLAGALAVGLWPGLARHADDATRRFTDRPAYAATVLRGAHPPAPPPPEKTPGPTASAALVGAVTAAAAVVGAGALLRSRRSDDESLPLRWLRRVHSGHVGDLVTWLVVGFATLGGAIALVGR